MQPTSRHPELLLASQYGAAGSSTRVRLYDWVKHLGITSAKRFEYRGTSSNSPVALLRDPVGTLRAELARRRLPRLVGQSTVVLSRELSQLSQGGNESALLHSARHGVYDFDDALYAPLPGMIGRVYSRRRVWERSVAAADVVLAGSDILAEAASRFNANVVMVPSCIEHTEYVVKSNFTPLAPPVAVWIGSPATEPYIRIAEEGLLQAHHETGLRLKVISAGSTPLGALDTMIDRIDWTPDGFTQELAQADFGIMPLPDDEWTRGKCAYKLLQYGAAGLPVVGSAVGANRGAIDKLGGFAVDGPENWGTTLIDLIHSATAEREAIGAQSRQGAIEHFSFAAWADTWRAAVIGT